MKMEEFPMLRAHLEARGGTFLARGEAFLRSIELASDIGWIRKSDHDGIKSFFGSCLEKIWTERVGAPFFHAGRWESQSREAQDLNHQCSPYSLHDLISVGKKLKKSACTDPAVQAMRSVCNEFMPLAVKSAELKGLIVKRGDPVLETPPKPPANPDQVRGTCSCCFRSIAVAGSGMAHHGYERPGMGFQTSSCSGIRFPNLEVSTKGLVWLISNTKDGLEKKMMTLDRKEEIEFLMIPRPRARPGVLDRIEKTDPKWASHFSSWERRLIQDIEGTRSYIGFLEEQLAHWTPEPAPQPDLEEDPSP